MCYRGKFENFDQTLSYIGGYAATLWGAQTLWLVSLIYQNGKRYIENLKGVNVGKGAEGYETALEAVKEVRFVLGCYGEEVWLMQSFDKRNQEDCNAIREQINAALL